MRSITIDAENEEEFNQEYERAKTEKSINHNLEKEKLRFSEGLEDEYTFSKHNFYDEDEDEYGGLGAFKEEEDELYNSSQNEKMIEDEEDNLFNNENIEERGIKLLCLYLKNTLTDQMRNEKIFYRNKNPLSILSGNAIYDLNFRELFDNLIDDNEKENYENNLGICKKNSNSLKDFICQNI